jgi:hypothetical protein
MPGVLDRYRRNKMRNYCKAYRLGSLRQFADWREKREEQGPELTDDDIVYLWDDYSVVRSPVQDKEPLFEAVTPAWKEFCHKTLKFAVPEDARTVSVS